MIFESNDVDNADQRHRDYWGDRHLERSIRAAIEESAELTIELLKLLREEAGESVPAPDRMERIVGELGDLHFCLEVIERAIGLRRSDLTEAVASTARHLDVKLRRLQFIANATYLNGGADYRPTDELR